MSIDLKSKEFRASRDVSDVIWIQTGFIGDIILTTAAMTALAKVAPNIKQRLITTAAGASALDGHPLLESIHVFKKKAGLVQPFLAILKELKGLNLRSPIIVQPHKSFRSTILARFLAFPTVTYEETSFAWTAAIRVPRVAVFHEADRISLLLQGLGFTRDTFLNTRPNLTAEPPPNSALALLDSQLDWIGLAPGSVWNTKRWPVANYARLACRILEDPKTGLVLLGGREDVDLCRDILNFCENITPTPGKKILNLAGKTTLKDLRGVYPYLKTIVTNDSSPIHYASAFNVPTVAIFGPTVPSMGFGPLADVSRIVQSNDKCRPCGLHGHVKCPLEHFNCMNHLSVEMVFSEVQSIRQSLGL